MNPQPEPGISILPKNLHQLIGLIAGNSMPTAVKRNSFIVNEVPREFQIGADESTLAIVLDSLLSTVASNSKHSCIRIKAKEYEDILFVSVRDNSLYSYTLDTDLAMIQALAKKINGTITVENVKEKFTTIILSFPNFPVAA